MTLREMAKNDLLTQQKIEILDHIDVTKEQTQKEKN